MAVSAEVQEQREYQEQQDLARRNHEMAVEGKRAKLELVRLAKETLIENNRSKPVGERDVSASDITSFATTLNNYINS